MAREHGQQLQKTLWDLQQRYGERVIDTLAHRALSPVISTGFPVLDSTLSSNGIPTGRLTVLTATSPSTSGITTLTYHVIAQAQRVAPVVYFDLSNSLDADYAANHNVALDRLLVVRNLDLVQALGLTRDVIAAGTASLVIIDAAALETFPSLSPAQFITLQRRMREALVKSQVAVLFLLPSPNRLLQTVKEIADVILLLERQGWQRHGRDIVGYSATVTVLKDKDRSGERQISIEVPLQRAGQGEGP